jgi:acid stress-induced BolA-like protein IbaG/YrbA
MKKSNLFRKRKLKNQMRKLINKRMIHALEIRKGKVKMKISVI